jgi:hypothetical protein
MSTKSRKKFLNESVKAKEQDKTLRVFVNERGMREVWERYLPPNKHEHYQTQAN